MSTWLGELIGIRPEPWTQDALCAQVGSDLWFPEKGGSANGAVNVCNRCPVRLECLQYALDHDERCGVWGGTSEKERRRLRRARPTRDPGICHNGHDLDEVGRDNYGYCRQCRRDNGRRSHAKRRIA